MANVQRLNYQIAPASKTNHLTDAKYIQGGYLSVDTMVELKSLPIVTYNADGTVKKDGIVVEGSMAYVREIDEIYIYQEDPRGSGVWKWKPYSGAAISWSYSTEPGDPVNVEVGGVEKGTTFNKATLDDLFDFIFHKDYPPVFNSLTSNVPTGTYEYGKELKFTKIIPKYTKGRADLNHLLIQDNLGNVLFDDEPVESGSTITLETPIIIDSKSKYIITATVTDTLGKEVSLKMEYDNKKYNYYGIGDRPDSAPTTTHKYTTESVDITTTDGTYIYIWSPTPKTKMQQYILGEWNDMDTTFHGQYYFTTDTNQILEYYIYRSAKLRAATNKYRII